MPFLLCLRRQVASYGIWVEAAVFVLSRPPRVTIRDLVIVTQHQDL